MLRNESSKAYYCIINDAVFISDIKKRHKELVTEMLSRGYKHNSNLKPFKSFKAGKINILANERELERRCKKCGFGKKRV